MKEKEEEEEGMRIKRNEGEKKTEKSEETKEKK